MSTDERMTVDERRKYVRMAKPRYANGGRRSRSRRSKIAQPPLEQDRICAICEICGWALRLGGFESGVRSPRERAFRVFGLVQWKPDRFSSESLR